MDFVCNSTSWSSFASLDSIPYSILYSIIEHCPEICKVLYGDANTDVTGIGAMISYAQEIVLALLVSSFVIIDSQVIRVFRPNHRITPVTSWLLDHHHTCLWTSLLFTFTFSLAGFVRQQGDMMGIWESSSIIGTIAITYPCLVLITVSFYRPLSRPRLFAATFILTTAFSLVVLLRPIWVARTEHILQVCVDYSQNAGTPWRNGAIGPYRIAELIISIVVIVAALSTWLFLRQDTIKWPKQARVHCVLVSGLLVFSLFIMCGAINSFVEMVTIRASMDSVWHGKTGVNSWSIGQIGAPFAWVPLLVDMTYDGIERIKRSWQSRSNARLESC